MILVDQQALEDILQYLTYRPWREVAHLIDNIRKDARSDDDSEERGES
jgi:hypothetical protein